LASPVFALFLAKKTRPNLICASLHPPDLIR
jgi:hypothetical protein